MKRVLFIQPPFFRFIGVHSRYFPYQFVSMGTYLKKNGHHVRILEGDKSERYGKLDFSNQESLYDNYLQNLREFTDPFWGTLKEEIQNFKPDYIGITVWTTFIASAIRTAQYCRKVCPSAIIIAGGPHVTLLPEDLKGVTAFDIGVIGEGEKTILEIVNGKPLNTISGIFYSENGDCIQNERREFEKNLDDFGTPDRSLLINTKRYEPEDMGLLMTSRGCPFKCSYCATSIWENKVRNRSVDNLIREIESVKSQYNTIYFSIKDDSFTINRKRVLEFCRKLKKERIKIYWECNANLSTLDRKMLLEMRSAGCIAMKVGVETGSDRIHEIINKKLTNRIVESKIRLFKGTGIHLTCYFMMGIPGESKEDILKTLEFAYKLNPDFISFSVYEIFPGTKLHEIGIEEKTASKNMELSEYFLIKPHNYFFADGKRKLANMSIQDFKVLEGYVKRKIIRFNRSPRSILKRARNRIPLYRYQFSYFLNDFKKFTHWI